MSYLLKALGYQVTANDFLHFPRGHRRGRRGQPGGHPDRGGHRHDLQAGRRRPGLRPANVEGLYFTGEDRRFLDSAWSHVDQIDRRERAMAISALVLAAARKQPRGVFTVTGLRYDDGRRDLRLPLREHFRERAAGSTGWSSTAGSLAPP